MPAERSVSMSRGAAWGMEILSTWPGWLAKSGGRPGKPGLQRVYALRRPCSSSLLHGDRLCGLGDQFLETLIISQIVPTWVEL